ncbi:MAG TPA: PTS glucitol/sorbitol transporter subunit IIA [Propionicimonas sp.]|uniref:PTS glucitol/sorbitol transporter subunit IIA n=1 Tax=Propionicimonas sp. TaxID=1955623 RepID=UPI002F3EBC37
MTQPVWQSTVVHIGQDAAEMFDAGVFILFGQPVPDALAEVSLVHSGPEADFIPVEAGDIFRIGDTSAVITEVGSLANDNFEKLGHFVIYLNVGDADVLPGAVKAEGTLRVPAVGDRVEIHRTVEG